MLKNLKVTNAFLKELPVEQDLGCAYRLVKDAAFCYTEPTPVKNPRLVALSGPALELVDIPLEASRSRDFVQYFSGNARVPGSEPVSHCYSGYQYGMFAGQLGDGAASYVGSVASGRGESWELQLKGTGRTPFSRAGADGRKVLRSSVREFLCSEAMQHLGIPTTRAGSLVASDTRVLRDALWTGAQEPESAAVLLRIAPTFLRIGSLEVTNQTDIATGLSGPSAGNVQLLRQLVEYTLKHFYPHIHNSGASPEQKYLRFFEELIQKTGKLAAQWQCVGFCHGVLNTDNISLVGLTLDYGPFSFLEQFDPDHISNGSDFSCLFSFGRQRERCRWCCERLSETLHPLVAEHKTKDSLSLFDAAYDDTYLSTMRAKLGLSTPDEDDKTLVDRFLETVRLTGADYTSSVRALSSLRMPGAKRHDASRTTLQRRLLNSCCSLHKLRSIYTTKPHPTQAEVVRSLWLLQLNPDLVPRHLQRARAAVDALNSRPILTAVQNLTEERKATQDRALWTDWVEQYARRLRKDADLDLDADAQSDARTGSMNRVNPRFVLKRSILQEAITKAEGDDYSMVNTLLSMVQDPYSEYPGMAGLTKKEDQEEVLRILGQFDADINSEACTITCSS